MMTAKIELIGGPRDGEVLEVPPESNAAMCFIDGQEYRCNPYESRWPGPLRMYHAGPQGCTLLELTPVRKSPGPQLIAGLRGWLDRLKRKERGR